MLLTTKSRYAVMAVIELASEKSRQPLSLLAISESQNISLSYLEQIFARLKKAGIVDSAKGPGGGYFLKKSCEKIAISDIIDAAGETIKMTGCSNGKKSCLGTSSRCKTHHLWHGLEEKIYDYLSSVSLAEITQGEAIKNSFKGSCQ